MVPIPPPRLLPAFPDAERVRPKTWYGGGKRARWKDGEAIYEWDSQHGAVEKYSSRGKHMGQYNSHTGTQDKGPDPSRTIEP